MSLVRQDTNRNCPYPLFGCPPPIELKENDPLRLDGDYYIILDILNSAGDPICANIQQPLIGDTAKFDIPEIFRGMRVMRSTIEDIETLVYQDTTGLQEFILQFTGYWSDDTLSACDRFNEPITPIAISVLNYLDYDGSFDVDTLTTKVLISNYDRRICTDSIINIPIWVKDALVSNITATFNGTILAQHTIGHDNVISVLRTDFQNWNVFNSGLDVTDGTIEIEVSTGGLTSEFFTYEVSQKFCCLNHLEIHYLNECGQFDYVLAKSVKDIRLDLRSALVCKTVTCREKTGGLIPFARTRADKIESLVIESCDEDHIEEFLNSLKKIIYENGKPVEVRNADNSYIIFRKNSRTFINYRYIKTVSKIALSQ